MSQSFSGAKTTRPKARLLELRQTCPLVEREGCGRLLINQFFFTNVRCLQCPYVGRMMGRPKNLKAVVADSQPRAHNACAGRE
jgi:hypothetical protein